MTRKRRRLMLIAGGMVLLSAAAGLVLLALQDTIMFFYSPSEVRADPPAHDRPIRLGGLIEEGSFKRGEDGISVAFRVTDLSESVPVVYSGILPDLFREGQGVVAEGAFGPDGVFEAREVLAKHDETYMPREVADALKQSGQWRGEGTGEEAPAQ